MGKYQLLSNIFPKGSSERVLSKIQRKPGFQLIWELSSMLKGEIWKIFPMAQCPHSWASSQPHCSLSACQRSSVPTAPALVVRAFPAWRQSPLVPWGLRGPPCLCMPREGRPGWRRLGAVWSRGGVPVHGGGQNQVSLTAPSSPEHSVVLSPHDCS